jgi:hypothetical protein
MLNSIGIEVILRPFLARKFPIPLRAVAEGHALCQREKMLTPALRHTSQGPEKLP